MKLYEFLNKYSKTAVDYDKAFGAQCVDLFRQFCKDVVGVTEWNTGSVDGAKDLYLNFKNLPLEQKYFIQKKASESKYGDVIIWDKTSTNKYGHVAIVINKINSESVLVFEQNGFAQDGTKFAIKSLNNCLGVLRLKNGGCL